MSITFAIKALNEERHIARAIESALAASRITGGEVLLADSGSTDRTIDIARTYPIRIVQLANPADACCGAGAQLGFQHTDNEYFYLLDGDMEVCPDFVVRAVDALASNPRIAAVGGRIVEMHTESAEFEIKVKLAQSKPKDSDEIVDRLDGGGLYRVSAVRDVGYFGDRNLHAFEEFDLAARLRSRGWTLLQLKDVSTRHYGHQLLSYALLRRRMKTRYTRGSGEILRGAWGRGHLGIVLRDLSQIRRMAMVIVWWLFLIAGAVFVGSLQWKAAAIAGALLAPLIVLVIRRKSIRLAMYSLVSWNVGAIGLILGLFGRRVDPCVPLASRIVA